LSLSKPKFDTEIWASTGSAHDLEMIFEMASKYTWLFCLTNHEQRLIIQSKSCSHFITINGITAKIKKARVWLNKK